MKRSRPWHRVMGKETKEQALRVGPCKLRLSLKVAMLLIDVIALQLFSLHI